MPHMLVYNIGSINPYKTFPRIFLLITSILASINYTFNKRSCICRIKNKKIFDYLYQYLRRLMYFRHMASRRYFTLFPNRSTRVYLRGGNKQRCCV